MSSKLVESEQNWKQCIDSTKDPFEEYQRKLAEHERAFDEEQANLKKSKSGFLGGLFGSNDDVADEIFEKKQLEKKKRKALMKHKLEADTASFSGLEGLKGLYLFGNPGKS